jgi:hypothetical protein
LLASELFITVNLELGVIVPIPIFPPVVIKLPMVLLFPVATIPEALKRVPIVAPDAPNDPAETSEPTNVPVLKLEVTKFVTVLLAPNNPPALTLVVARSVPVLKAVATMFVTVLLVP